MGNYLKNLVNRVQYSSVLTYGLKKEFYLIYSIDYQKKQTLNRCLMRELVGIHHHATAEALSRDEDIDRREALTQKNPFNCRELWFACLFFIITGQVHELIHASR